jgi:putative (di)nucleoside polyphosphate hydrolase
MAELPYRKCVGIMVLNREGLVFTGKRKAKPDAEESGTQFLWQMPQGGIDKDEDPEPAARRELYEETGIRSIALLAQTPDWVRYDLPQHLVGVALKGKYRGQQQMWFAYRFEGEDSEIAIDPPPDGHTAEFEAWQWRPMHELPDLVIPFKRKVYEEVVACFAHLSRPR